MIGQCFRVIIHVAYDLLDVKQSDGFHLLVRIMRAYYQVKSLPE